MSDTLRAELAEYEYQLEQISGALEADPVNEELLTLKNELQDLITLTKSRLSSASQPDVQNSKASSGDAERKRKHDSQESRKVGDQVLAKWIGGDHQFYPARITSITGNQADPVYTVKFLEYNEVQTLHGHQLRTINEHKKRDIVPARNASASPAIPPPPPGVVASLSTDKSATADVKSPPKKKVSTLKEDLAKSANSWNSFAKTGPKTTKKVGKRKAIGESSMFRTEEGGRVGVIGSGKAMTADPGKRGRHVFGSDR